VADKLSQDQRSALMARVKTRDTEPEIAVRKLLHSLGYRFRLTAHDLPGKPDIVLPKYKAAIFVHGCFWHGHKRCTRGTRPSSNADFWNHKIDGNIRRDRKVQRALKLLGWHVLVLWQCRIANSSTLRKLIDQFLEPEPTSRKVRNVPNRFPAR
jgi:DNA mismatch endonuclease (patch repair protein)